MIDLKLQTELREKFNPDNSDLRKIQLRLLEILSYIDKRCRENDIKYWLSSGTCLGAIRHEGFIPWDDDCDIEMYKKDYEKLKKIVIKDNIYDWQDSTTDTHYIYPFGKIRDRNSHVSENNGFDHLYKYNGIFVDVFIMSPSNSKYLRKVSGFIYTYASILISKIKDEKIAKTLKKILVHFYIPIAESIQKPFSKGRLRHISGTYFFKERYRKDIFPLSQAEFENLSLPVPNDSNSYLNTIFGDYMVLPEINKISRHMDDISFND